MVSERNINDFDLVIELLNVIRGT